MNEQQTKVMLIDLQPLIFCFHSKKKTNVKLTAENLLLRLRLAVKLRQDFLSGIYHANCRSISSEGAHNFIFSHKP